MKTFVLGVGAQKAGTSWLHNYLNSRSDADFGFCKEYHIHDVRTVGMLKPFQRQLQGSLVSRAYWNLQLLAKPRTRRRLDFCRNPSHYYDYFEQILQRPEIAISGDISPSYCRLSPQTMGEIRSQIEGRGLRIRTVFLMRDPVERLISRVRNNLRKRNKLTPENELATLRQAIHERPEGIDSRSNYRHTLQALDQAFEPEQLQIHFYESLFQEESIQSLCRQLHIPYVEANLKRRVNASATDTRIPEEILLGLGQWQRETWRYCRDRFHTVDLAALWPTASRWCEEAAQA